MVKKQVVMHVGDVIVNTEGKKIGHSRMDAVIEGGFFQLAFDPTPMFFGSAVEDQEPVTMAIHKINTRSILDTGSFGVWQCDISEDIIADFCREPQAFFVPEMDNLADPDKDLATSEQYLKMFKDKRPMHVITGSPVLQCLEDLHNQLRYHAEKGKQKR